MKNGGEKEWTQLRDFYLNCDDAIEKDYALKSLGYIGHEQTINRMLDWLLKSEDVKSQDTVFLLRILAANSKTGEKTWNFVQVGYGFFQKRSPTQRFLCVLEKLGYSLSKI